MWARDIRADRDRPYRSAYADDSAWVLLRAAVQQLHMQPKTAKRTVGVAKTIALLASSPTVRSEHMAEAIQYRPRS